MKNFVYIVLTIATMLNAESIQVLPKPADFTTQQRKPMPKLQITAEQAFNKIKPQIDAYLKNATPSEREALISYLGYYRSWYQSTTPAPVELQKSLTPASNNLVNNIKEVAKAFTLHFSPTQRPGSSTLNQNGHDYYSQVIDYLQKSSTTAASVALRRVEPAILLVPEIAPQPIKNSANA